MGKILESLFGKTILIVGGKGRTNDLVGAAFQPLHCRILTSAEHSEALRLIHSDASIEVVIVEIEGPVSNGFAFLDMIRPLDHERPPVFFLAEQRDPYFDEAFFRGVEAIFVKPLNYDELVKGVEFSHDLLMDHDSGRRHKRRRIRRAKVLVTNEITGATLNGYVTNFSAGGMFVCSMYTLPRANERIQFKMIYEIPAGAGSDPKQIEISGHASVRWVRPQAHLGRPPGFGIEFKDLDDQSREAINMIIDRKD